MIDDQSQDGSWERALQPDNRSLRTLTDRELGDKHLPDRVMQWHGLTYGYEARDMIAAERTRRTSETVWNG